MVAAVDKDQDGRLNFEEFSQVMEYGIPLDEEEAERIQSEQLAKRPVEQTLK